MANEIFTEVKFFDLTKEGKAKLAELIDKAGVEHGERSFGELFLDDTQTADDAKNIAWSIDNLGTKWAFITDYEDTYLHLNSAWNSPMTGIGRLVEQLAEVSEGLQTAVSYDDGTNEIGGYLFQGADLVDEYYIDGDVLTELFEDEHKDILKMVDEDGDLTEEGDDYFYENIYEFIHDTHVTNVNDMLENN